MWSVCVPVEGKEDEWYILFENESYLECECYVDDNNIENAIIERSY